MTLEELNELDFSNIGEWPLIVKLILVVILAGAVAAGGYFMFIEEQFGLLEREKRVETDLRQQFETKQGRAANLDGYKRQLAEMRKSFGAMLRQLPDKTEVAALLVDVSQTGLGAGLDFLLFQPQAEIKREFYAELPISIKVTGTYHEFGDFISGLAALPRIVTIHDIKIAPAKAKGAPAGATTNQNIELELSATAKTYRYLEGGG